MVINTRLLKGQLAIVENTPDLTFKVINDVLMLDPQNSMGQCEIPM
jgi:hypothetical protein